MLHEFLTLHRDEILSRTRQEAGARSAPQPTEAVLEHGVPLFLEELAATLRREQETGAHPTSPETASSGVRHGAGLRHAGFTVGQVVHGYADVCRVVTNLASELGIPISAEEFKALDRCLDEAIAQEVTEYARQGDPSNPRGAARHGYFVHEQRNLVHNAILAFEVLKTGKVGVGSSTAQVLGRNLIALRDLIDRSLVEVRLEAGLHHRQRVMLGPFVDEVGRAGTIEAEARGLQLSVYPGAPGVEMDVDRHLLAAAIANLLQNAFKFSRANGHVVLRTNTTAAGRVLIEVEDECGGLPPGRAEELFRPFAQRSADRSGLGLGLAIARESVERNGGEIRTRNLPGRGCVFTIDLPRLPRRSAAVAGSAAVAHPSGTPMSSRRGRVVSTSNGRATE